MSMCTHNISFTEVTKQVPDPKENKQESCLTSPIEKIFINNDYIFIKFKSEMEDFLSR